MMVILSVWVGMGFTAHLFSCSSIRSVCCLLLHSVVALQLVRVLMATKLIHCYKKSKSKLIA